MKGDGSLYKRGNVWWMKYYVGGVVYQESTGQAVKEDAKKRLRDKIAETRKSGWLPPDRARITVGELVADALRGYELKGKLKMKRSGEAAWRLHLRPVFEHVRADQVGTQLIQEYQSRRLAEGAANGSVNRELQLLGAAFKAALKHDPPKITKPLVIDWLPEDNARRVFIDGDLAQKLKAAASKRGLEARVWLEIAFTYGWRRGDILGLCVRNISLADRTVRLDTSKNGEGREVPITDALMPLLTALVVGRKADEKLLRYTTDTLHAEWYRICADVGVKPGATADGFTPHDIRRSSARNKRRAGVDVSVIMDMQGWKTDEMFRRYAIVDIQDKKQALEMERRAGGNA